MSRLRLAVIGALALVGGAARAETVQANATTLLLGRRDFRLPPAGATDVTLQTAVPLYELLDVTASDLKTSFTNNLEIGLSTWGALDLADRRFWQNGGSTGSSFSGDVNTAYVRADMLDRHLTLRLGRTMVADGASRMVQIDGAEARVALPGGFGLQGYVGSPVAPRFAGRGGELTVGNIRAVFATGGRASWRYGSLLDLGASVAIANDRSGDASQRDVGVDFRLTPLHLLQLSGTGFWSIPEHRIGEAKVAATVFPLRNLDITADYRHVEPDLFLPRTSIFSVFASDKRNDVGGSFHWGVLRNVAVDGDYHYLIEDARERAEADDPQIPASHGHWGRLKLTAHPYGFANTVGLEGSVLEKPENGYQSVRAFGGTEWNALQLTLDLLAYFYDKDVNGQRHALTGTLTVAREIFHGWKAALAGTAASTPYLEHEFEIMAKLVYGQTYAVREVR